MKKINFASDVLPHAIAVATFLIITVFFFNPIFFKHQTLNQHDITQSTGTVKQLKDFREKTHEEPLWASAVFSGMPAYLINVEWSNGVVSAFKKVLALDLPHPVSNIFLAFICYYIMLLVFGVRPYLAITGAIAFGLSSFMIIGLGAGHNGRIGATAFIPLVIAGVHLAFKGKRILGLAVTALGFALHLRENHLQMTYYMAIIIGAYGLVFLIYALREKTITDYLKTIGVLVLAVALAIGTFFGQLWSVTEYSTYTMRGKSEISSAQTPASGLSKSYAFAYSNGIFEPMVLIFPNFYGGSSSNFLVRDQDSHVYKALASSGDQNTANQLANYTGAYWGPQGLTSPYYAGAIICFLFVVGILFADKKYVWWLVPISVLGIMLSWGSSFATFNNFIFDYLPGYNKFRSVTFTISLTLFALPLLGLLGLEKLITTGLDKSAKKKLIIAFISTGGLCFFLFLFAGMASFMKEGESQLPAWFTNALVDDRKSLFRSDAFRSLAFILIAFATIYFELWKRISVLAFCAILAFLTVIDLSVVDKRYFTADNFQRSRENAVLAMTEADKEILKDQSYYRVYNLQDPMAEAHTSYYHNSIGGYHGAKMKSYQDLYDSCLVPETNALIKAAQAGSLDFKNFGVINMLNIKYITYGPGRDNIIPNAEANGSAWFVSNVEKVKTSNDEILKLRGLDTKQTVIINESKFTIPAFEKDSAAVIKLIDHKPNAMKYESESSVNGLAVFSEIYYPKGWKATIDGKEAEIIKADFVLRALAIPAGKHTIEFTFKPAAYFVGDKVSQASSWVLLLVLLGGIGLSLKKES
jgi:hypothetical protein